MAQIDIINSGMKKVGDVQVADGFMNEPVNKPLLYLALKRHLSSLHHGTVKTQDRSEVSLTGKKAYRQKGTGNARHGSRRPSPFVGGGRVFGPRPRDYTENMPKQARRKAIGEGIKARILAKELIVIDELKLTEAKTKQAVKLLGQLQCQQGALIILAACDQVLERSFRNIPNIKVATINQLNVFDLLKYKRIVCDAKAFGLVNERYLVN